MSYQRGYKVSRFWVSGLPLAQGSMRSPKAGVVIHNSPALTSWRAQIAWAAKEDWRGAELIDEPVHLTVTFNLPKPKKPRHPWYADTALDLDKLIRAVGDALQGVILKNDSRIVRITATKVWAGSPISRHEPGLYVHLETVGW